MTSLKTLLTTLGSGRRGKIGQSQPTATVETAKDGQILKLKLRNLGGAGLRETPHETTLFVARQNAKGLSFKVHRAPAYLTKNVEKKIDLRGSWNAEFAAVADRIVAGGATYLMHDRLHTLWQAVRNTRRSTAAIAEIGVHRGGGSCFLAEAQRSLGKSGRIFACDTFAGHAVVSEGVDGQHQVGGFGDNLDVSDVMQRLSAYPEISVVVGDIMQTAPDLAEQTFALVHLDVDVYLPSRFCLDYFAPRLIVGGIIVVDDYGFRSCPGAKQAVDEFMIDRTDFVQFHLTTAQALLVKTSEAGG